MNTKTTIHTCTVFLLLFICTCTSVAQEKRKNYPRNEPVEIRIVPESAANEVPASEFVDSVIYIPLETSKASAFGHISKLEVTEEYFIVLDAVTTKSVLIFQRNGKFFTRIEKFNGKTFSSIYNIHVIPETKKIIVSARVDGTRAPWLVYDFQGNQLSSETFRNCADLYIFPNGDSAFAYGTGTPSNLLITRKNTKANNLFSIDTSNLSEDEIISKDQYFFNSPDSGVFFTRPYDYNVYTLTDEGALSTPYKFIFPADISLPVDFINNDAYKGKRTKMRDGKITGTDFFYKHGQNISFTLNGAFSGMLTYNLETAMLYAVEQIKPDQNTYFLPATKKQIYAADKTAVYSVVSSLDMFNAAEACRTNKNWKQNLPKKLRDYFETKDKNANPVITKIHLKQN